MKPFNLEAKHMVLVNETAFPKDAATKAMRNLVKAPKAVIQAIENTPLRFSLIPQKRRAIRLA